MLASRLAYKDTSSLQHSTVYKSNLCLTSHLAAVMQTCTKDAAGVTEHAEPDPTTPQPERVASSVSILPAYSGST